MSRRAMTTDTDGRLSVMDNGKAITSTNGITVNETKWTDALSTRDVDEIVVAVLRIFAARGRTLREERTKQEVAQLLDANAPNVPSNQEAGSTGQDTNKDMPDH